MAVANEQKLTLVAAVALALAVYVLLQTLAPPFVSTPVRRHSNGFCCCFRSGGLGERVALTRSLEARWGGCFIRRRSTRYFRCRQAAWSSSCNNPPVQRRKRLSDAARPKRSGSPLDRASHLTSLLDSQPLESYLRTQ